MMSGVVYDQRMADHKCLWDSKYNERPERFTSVLARCKELNLLQRCLSIKPREATEDELLKLHTPDMITKLKDTENLTDEVALEDLSSQYDFLYIHPNSYRLSLLAAGSTVELVSQILDGNIRNGMAIIRPPGHHAMKSEYCGYCFYNNVAIAAQHALDNRGIKRILIVDWDIHHGQATQQMFYDDPRVLYFSIHGYQNGAFWPHLRESDYHYIGRGAGLGYNINIPMNKIKMGNGDYMAIFHQLLLPIAYEFNPELVIVSAGYDAALGCPEGEMEVTPACYSHFTKSLMGLANGRLAVILEGGYCLKSLSEGAALTMRTLLGDPCPVIHNLNAPTKSAQESILSATYVLRRYWYCLQHLETYAVSEIEDEKKIGENQFWPKIQFFGLDEKPEKYQTRDICPTQDPEVAADLDRQLDILISGTCLNVPEEWVAFVTSSEAFAGEQPKIISRFDKLSLERALDKKVFGDPSSGYLLNLADNLIDGKSRSGVAVGENCNKNLVDFLKYAVDERNLERILFVDLKTNRDPQVQKAFEESTKVLCVTLGIEHDDPNPSVFATDFVGANEAKGFTVNVNLPQADSNDMGVFTAFFRILLPIAYKFAPQLVVLSVNQSLSGNGITEECFGQIIHLLTSLAGGRLAVVFDENVISLSNVEGLENCAKVLLGDPICLRERNHERLDAKLSGAIRSVIREHSPYWDCFKFNVELPDRNVLIPPFIQDSKILECNPELQQL